MDLQLLAQPLEAHPRHGHQMVDLSQGGGGSGELGAGGLHWGVKLLQLLRQALSGLPAPQPRQVVLVLSQLLLEIVSLRLTLRARVG